MSFETTYYHRETSATGSITFESDELSEGQFRGEINLELADQTGKAESYILSNSQDILISPYEIPVKSNTGAEKISIRITGSDPKLKFLPSHASSEDCPLIYHFQLPDLQTLKFCHRFLKNGFTEELHAEIDNKYEQNRSSILTLVREAKYCLQFSDYVELLAAASKADEQVCHDLKDGRHGFFKNLIRRRRVGKQFPIRNHEEFISRINQYDSQNELKSIDKARVIEQLIDDASDHGTRIDDLCSLDRPFIEVASVINIEYFINLIAESILTDFDVSTATARFNNDLPLAPWPLVKQRYNNSEVEESFEELSKAAYDSQSVDDWHRALAAVEEPDSPQFHHGLAGLLYWYTETTHEMSYELQPKIYATAAALFDAVNNDFMADAAAYQASLKEGFFRRQNGDYESARQEFMTALNISSSWDKGPFNEVHAFIKSIETDIEEYREQGKFMEAFRNAEYGFTELTEGRFRENETTSFEVRMRAWKDDLQAQNQSINGQFQEAIETTNDAIAGFRSAGLDGHAQTAQTRRYQLQAIQAQLDLDFKKASNHHLNAEEQAVNKDTEHFHRVNADLCHLKQHLLDGELDIAREKITNLNEEEPNVNNLRMLVDVYDDYQKGEKTAVSKVVDNLETGQSKGRVENRHISYDGDYISAVIHVVASQRLGQQNVPVPVLDHITRAAIKNAVSGGSSHEWAEISELSQINAEDTWRLLIPSVIQSDIEYIEYNAEKGTHPNYSMSGLKLIAVLEGYLRVMVEYYAKREYGSQWQEKVVSRSKITLGDIYNFFESDDAADRISVRNEIHSELDDLRYFDANSDISDVRNDLSHENLSWIDEEVFQELKNHVFEIMRLSAFDCPVIAEVGNVTEQHQIYFGSANLHWNRIPRRAEISTTTKLEEDQSVYLPPDPTIESGMVEIDSENLEISELVPEEVEKHGHGSG